MSAMHSRNFRRYIVIGVTAVPLLVAVAAGSARPNRYGHSDREERHMFPAVSSGPLDPAWSPDGRRIATGSDDKTVRVYEVDGGRRPTIIRGHEREVSWVAWSPGGERVATASKDGTARLWRADGAGPDRARTAGAMVLHHRLAAGGRRFDDALAAELAREEELTLLCGRYEGFDERVHEHLATDVVSIGPYVLSGGELAAMVVCDAVLRKLPGTLGHAARSVTGP